MSDKNMSPMARGKFNLLETIILRLFIDPLRTPFRPWNHTIGFTLPPSRSQLFKILVKLAMHRSRRPPPNHHRDRSGNE